MRNQRLDTIIVIALPVAVTLGWCSLVWNEPPDNVERDYRHPDTVTINDPGLFLAPKATVVISPPNLANTTSSQPLPSAIPTKKVKSITAVDTGPTDWVEDPELDDDLIGSCGKRYCDCSDTFESCESDIDCCNGYDVCIKNKCERYEDY